MVVMMMTAMKGGDGSFWSKGVADLAQEQNESENQMASRLRICSILCRLVLSFIINDNNTIFALTELFRTSCPANPAECCAPRSR